MILRYVNVMYSTANVADHGYTLHEHWVNVASWLSLFTCVFYFNKLFIA